MKTNNQHHWKKTQVLLGLYIIIFLHKFGFTSGSPTSDPPSFDKHFPDSKTDISKRFPHKLTTNERHLPTSYGKSLEKSDNSGIFRSSATFDRMKKITKRSPQMSGFPNKFLELLPYDDMKASQEGFKPCEDDSNYCRSQTQNDEIQQINNFRTNNKIPLDNLDYSNSKNPEESNYLPNVYYNNLRLFHTSKQNIPYSQEPQNVDNNAYYVQDDVNKITDSDSHNYLNVHGQNDANNQFPTVAILGLPKPRPLELTGQSNPIPNNDQQGMQDENPEEQPIQEVKKNIFTSRGWGAGGMPFSVLYMHKQQHLKPVPRLPIPEAQQLIAPQPLRGFPTATQYRQVAVRNALSSSLASGSNGGGTLGTPLPTRRQYSIIPQLYVSYGWGPHGK